MRLLQVEHDIQFAYALEVLRRGARRTINARDVKGLIPMHGEREGIRHPVFTIVHLAGQTSRSHSTVDESTLTKTQKRSRDFGR